MIRSTMLSASIALVLALAHTSANAQEVFHDDEAEGAPELLDQVVVTGTRASDRTVAESLSPIDVISQETLQATGTTELATALARVLPALNFPRPAVTDGTSAIRPAQLRGLAPDQVLVLVNGKRRHTTALLNVNGSQGRGSSPVDLNAIPIAAIARVEVLRDGASAQYGSDAIAGVINIVLNNDAGGGGLNARYGQYSAGDGAQGQLSGHAGFAIGDDGFVHVAAQFGDQDSSNRARPFAGTPSATQPLLGQKAFIYGDPEVADWGVSVNSEIPIGDVLKFYAFAMAGERDITSFAFFRAPGNVNQNVPSIYPQGFLPEINNVADDRSMVAGLKGDFAEDWHWDLSYNYGFDHLDFYTRNSLNASLGPTSPTSFYAGGLELTQNIINFDLSRALDLGLAYPVNLALGAEYREDKWNQSPGAVDSWRQGPIAAPVASGAQGFPGFRPGDAGQHKRDSRAVYADVESDFNDRFSAGAALRYEDYSDFGSQVSGKLSARYAFDDRLALRGTVASGFRAPSLSQQNYQTTSTGYLAGFSEPFEIRTFRASSDIAQALGAEPLRAEESFSYGLGLVLQPVERLYVTIDAYQIDVDDRVVLSANLTGNVRQFLEARGIFGVSGGRYFTNAVDTRTRGIDLVGSYGWDVGEGSIDLTASYGYSETDITRIADNPIELQSGGLNLERIDRAERGRIERGFPRDKAVLGAAWNSGDWTFTAGTTRYGSFAVTPANAANDQVYSAKWLLDLAATYRLDRWSLTVGVDNVLDEYPDENLFGNSFNGQFPYSSAAPFGFNGAYLYANVGVRW